MKIKKKLIILISIIMAILCLSGCTRQEYNVVITEQNGVQFETRVILDKESYNMLSTFNVDLNEVENSTVEGTGTSVDRVNALFQEEAMKFKIKGFDITPLDDAVELGFIAKKNYLTIEEFNAEIQELCKNHMSGLNLDIQYTDTTNHKEYKAYGTLSYVVDPDMGFEDESIKSMFDKQYDSTGMTARATIQMPSTTQITASDGITSTNGAMEWTASYEKGTSEVHVISEFHDNSLYYIIALIAIVVAAIVGFFILRAMRYKKEKQNSALKDEYEYEQKGDQR